MSKSPDGPDVLDLLVERHEQIRITFTDIVTAQGDAKAERFDELITLLAVHDAVEQELLHRTGDPGAEPGSDGRPGGPGGSGDRLVSALSQMSAMEPKDEGFDARLISVGRALTLHAESQERQEFPRLRAELSSDELHALAEVMLEAEARATDQAGKVQPGLSPSDLGGGTPGLLSALNETMKGR